MTGYLYGAVAILVAAGSVGLVNATSAWVQVAAAVCLLLAGAPASVLVAGAFTGEAVPRRQVWGSPPGLATFRGRHSELKELCARFDGLSSSGSSNGAIILAIHGMPGVGKSALAQELARQLGPRFSDGQLYANLGNAGRIRAEADILNRFVTALRPADRVPGSTVERAARFRSLTASAEVLVILDAARDHEQVARLLPSGEKCAVIVTSRRDLGPALGIHSYQLGVPDTDDSLEILHAVSHTPSDEDHKFAIEIVDRLGRLPLAIRAVGDSVIEHTGSLPPAARRLRKPDPLDWHGQVVQDRIESEYGRLTSDESRAFRLASLIETPSFVPWMLTPLLSSDERHNVDQIEVEKIVSRLAERQLLEPAGFDEVTGLDRYRFHPVFRQFAESQRTLLGDDTESAMERVDEAYLDFVDLTLAGTTSDPGARRSRWFPEESSLPLLTNYLPDRWVRAEYRSLLRCVQAAYLAGRYEICWRIGGHLGNSVPSEVDRQSVIDALDLAENAAVRLRDKRARVEVLLARGGFLGRSGGFEGGEPKDGPDGRAAGHAEAFDALAEAASIANRLRPGLTVANGQPPQREDATGPQSGLLINLESEAYRRLAETHLRAGAFRDAARELDRAALLAGMASDKHRSTLVDLMRIAIPGRIAPADIPAVERVDDELGFWHGWASAEVDRRAGEWDKAAGKLRLLLQRFEDDASRVACILLRIAELRLEELLWGPARDPERSRTRAVHRAAEAVYRFQHMHDYVGETRARCVFVRGLLTMGRVREADEQYSFAVGTSQKLEPLVFHELSPLRAMLWQAQGELLRRQNSREGLQALFSAARLFRAHGDLAGQASALAVAGVDQLPPETFDPGPPGREPHTWLEADGDTLRIGLPFQVCYTIGAPALTEDLPPAGGRYVDVLLVADSADIYPRVHTARLDPWAQLGPLRFEVTPKQDGPLNLELLVYSANGGTLLQKSELEPQQITGTDDGQAQ